MFGRDVPVAPVGFDRSLLRRSSNVKAMIRGLASLVGALTFLAALGPAGALRAQSRSDVEIPRLMVLPFKSNEKGLGSEASEAVRQRIANDLGRRTLMVITKSGVCANLEASGFSCDSAPDQLTSKLLGSALRSEEYLEGTITKTGKMMRLETLFYITGFPDATQVLPTDSSTSLGNLAEQVSKSFAEARKQVPAFIDCMHALQNGKTDSAIIAAKAGIAAYPPSTASRVCLANALLRKDAPSDSVIAVAARVVQLDPHNKLALGLVAEEYRKRGQAFKNAGQQDSARVYLTLAVEAWASLIEADPRNVILVSDIVNRIAASGYAAAAKPIIMRAVAANPGDPDLVRLEWQILLATRDTADLRLATKVGDEMVRVDTSAADTTYFIREAAAYAQLGDVTKAAAITTAGINKFPLNPSLWGLNSQIQRLAGNAQGAADAAAKLIQIEPSNGQGYILLARAEFDLQQQDATLAAIRKALNPPKAAKAGPLTTADSARAAEAAHADSADAGQLALVLGNRAFKAAQAAQPQRVEDYITAVDILSLADSAAPNDGAKFLRGYAAFRVADIAVRQNVNAKKCDLARQASEYFTIAQVSIAAGGKFNPQAAGQLLGNIQQYLPTVEGQLKRYCK
jgi:predicted Zn-dependent protease